MSTVVGPWGGSGGISWDDGSNNGIRGITVFAGAVIDSISVVYDKNGEPNAAGKHGGTGGNQAPEIKLQHPEEYLVSVSGHYGSVPFSATPLVRSLTFTTNKGAVFGPYGTQEGIPFSLPIQGGRFVGFVGRSSSFLDAIGFRISPKP